MKQWDSFLVELFQFGISIGSIKRTLSDTHELINIRRLQQEMVEGEV